VADQLHLRGAEVVVYDPAARETAARRFTHLAYATSLHEAVAGADLVLLLTEWSEFVAMDPVALGEKVAQKAIVDGRNVLDPEGWRAAGWQYRALGR
jgi:UDPglucose 6-dehydrogenase